MSPLVVPNPNYIKLNINFFNVLEGIGSIKAKHLSLTLTTTGGT